MCSILFQYSNTEPSFIVSRTLQSKTSSWLNSKEKLFHLSSGSNKSSDAKGKRSAWGLSVLVPPTSTHTSSFVRSQEFQARRFFWNLTELGHRERRFETRDPNFLLDDPNFISRTIAQMEASRILFIARPGLILKAPQKGYSLNHVYT